MERVFDDPPGILVYPDAGLVRGAVLVLSGSSGRVEAERARLLARHGVAAMSYQWFAERRAVQGICEVALESFTVALNQLVAISGNLAIIGTSKGNAGELRLGAGGQG